MQKRIYTDKTLLPTMHFLLMSHQLGRTIRLAQLACLMFCTLSTRITEEENVLGLSARAAGDSRRILRGH